MVEKKKVENVMEKAAQQLKNLVDVNTVVGKPIRSASGCEIIPLTKVTMGCLSGGGEYGDVKAIKEDECFPFAGGAGTIVSVKPVGFLVDDGGVRFIKITDDPLNGLIEKASEFLSKMSSRDEHEEV